MSSCRVILDLNMIPQLMLPEDWALPGPGAQRGLRMIFGKSLPAGHIGLALSWVHEHFEKIALAAGYSMKDIPALKPSAPGLSLVDIEHVLCEFSKYVKIYERQGKPRTKRPYGEDIANPKITCDLPMNWKPAHVAVAERNRRYTNPEAEENGEHEPAAVVGKAHFGGELWYKVRWEGWGPAADTWERAAMLKTQTPAVVAAFEGKITRINDLLAIYRED